MGDYFKPWRRKLGVVVVVLACLFTGGLIRSDRVRDTVNVWVGPQSPVLLISTSRFLIWGNVFLDPGTGATLAYWNTEVLADSNLSWKLMNRRRNSRGLHSPESTGVRFVIPCGSSRIGA